MRAFPSLRDFLCMKDPLRGGSIHKIGLPADRWPEYYDIARANWTRYGADGPPDGSHVFTLTGRHTGHEGQRRAIKGRDSTYLLLTKLDESVTLHLVERETWWLQVSHKDFLTMHFEYKGWASVFPLYQEPI